MPCLGSQNVLQIAVQKLFGCQSYAVGLLSVGPLVVAVDHAAFQSESPDVGAGDRAAWRP